MPLHRIATSLAVTAAFSGWLAIVAPAGAQTPPQPTPPPVPPAQNATPPQHIRGTLESVQGNAMSVKTARGTSTIKLSDDTKVFLVSPADISAIKDGKFVGITSVEKDGKRVAKEVHVFDDSLRGLGEGHYPWDLESSPNMMTNANIARVESVGGDHVLKLDYKGGSQTIAVPPDAAIVTFTAATREQLQPDSKVFLLARKQDDGSLTAVATVVGKDGLKPPM